MMIRTPTAGHSSQHYRYPQTPTAGPLAAASGSRTRPGMKVTS